MTVWFLHNKHYWQLHCSWDGVLKRKYGRILPSERWSILSVLFPDSDIHFCFAPLLPVYHTEVVHRRTSLACPVHACPSPPVCPYCSTFLSTALPFQHLFWLITHKCSQQSLGLNVVIALRVKECKQISTRCPPWQTVINEVEMRVETRSACVFFPFFMHMLHSIIIRSFLKIFFFFLSFPLHEV